MKLLQVRLQKAPDYRWFVRLVALGFALWIVVLSPVEALAQPNEHQPVQDTTASDLSDIPNLEQMDYDKFEEYFGDVPNDRKPLFNPDNGKSQTIEDKDPDSKKFITPADLKEHRPDAETER